MKYSEIISRVEKAISDDIDIVGIDRVEQVNLTSPSDDLFPGKSVPPGYYGVVDLRLMVTI